MEYVWPLLHCAYYTQLSHYIIMRIYILIYSILYILLNVTPYIDIGVVRALYVAVAAHSKKNISIHLTI